MPGKPANSQNEHAMSQRLREVLEAWENYAEKKDAFQRDFGVAPELPSVLHELFRSTGETPQKAPRHTSPQRRMGRKPNVQVYAEILGEQGPMHGTDLGKEAIRRGVSFKGKRPIALLVRDALNKAPTRFINLGANVWNLVGKEATKPTNGKVRHVLSESSRQAPPQARGYDVGAAQ